jgi:hypothetical protein
MYLIHVPKNPRNEGVDFIYSINSTVQQCGLFVPSQSIHAMKIKRLKELKQRIVREKDLSKIWLFYMDNFADHAEFTDLGEPIQNDYLDAILPQICKQMFGRTVKIKNFLAIYLAEYRFCHGPFEVEGRIGGVIYFEEIKTGLLAVSENPALSNEVKYSRFSVPIQLSAPRGHELN